MDREFWDYVLKVREAVSKELEILRVRGQIGSSLDGEVECYADEHAERRLAKLGDELRFLLLTSYARVLPKDGAPQDTLPTDVPGLELRLASSEHPKCIRCWHHRHDVGINPEHPELCGRCVANVAGAGETRLFA
jgi:isoleucyl-tRNA synthetase